MTSILVVEHEGRYIERIQDALASEGWSPRFVAGRPEALRAAASEAPSLVLVNAELPGAPELLGTFARRNGGPGAVALVAEQAAGGEARADADEVLAKPFTDQQLRLVVRRGLAAAAAGGGRPGPGAARTAARAAGDGAEERKLTSAEIFGDVLAEIESEISGHAPAAAAAERPAAGQVAAAAAEAGRGGGRADEPTGVGAGGPAEAAEAAEAAGPAPTPAAPTAEPRPRPFADDEEIDRKLEKTLSGVLGDDRPRPRVGSPADRRPPPKSVKPAPDDDVEELLNMTLAGLDLGPGRKGLGAPAAGAGAREESPFSDLDLSELEALADTGRRKARRAEPSPRPTLVPPPGDHAAEERSAAPPPEPPAAAAAPTPAAEPPAAEPFAGEPETAPVEAAEAPAEPERRFGHYTLLERIAAGGMAEVWKARMRGVEGFQKTVAIKKILPHMTHDPDFVGMFIDEAKLAAQLNHPNIIHIYDLGKLGGDFYIAMEYVDGRNLRALLDQARARGETVPLGLALLIGARLASALDYAHRKRDFDGAELELVHRDVSPQNVLLSTDGDIKLCDFGISKAVAKVSQTQSGALKGKLQYMSPEQAWGRPVDSRSDVFSLGALLFEMLSGERLFTGDSEISVLEAVRECSVRSPREVRPEIPEEVEAVVLQALAAEPADRFQTAGELQQELERALHRLHPAPTPADLAAYLRRLDAAGAAAGDRVGRAAGADRAVPAEARAATGDGGDRRPATFTASSPGVADAGPAAPGSWSGVSPAGSEVHPERPLDATAGGAEPAAGPPAPGAAAAGGTGAGRTAAGAGGAPAVPDASAPIAPPGEGEVEVEEGGRRRRWLLVTAIVLVLAAAAVFWWIYGSAWTPARQGPPPPAVVGDPPAEATTSPPVQETPAEPAGGPEADLGEPAETAPPDLEDILSREMARKEEELRRQVEAEYREQQRRLEERLARARAAAADAESEPEPAPEGEPEGDGGGSPGSPPGGAPPGADGASLSVSTNLNILPRPGDAPRTAAPVGPRPAALPSVSAAP